MRSILICLLLTLSTASAWTQKGFIYGGYRLGRYLFNEAPSQNYAAKFNAGWEFQPDGAPIPIFRPGVPEFEIKNYMEWNNNPGGITFGMMAPIDEKWGLGFSYQQFGQKSGGERINVATGTSEKFSIKSKSSTVGISISYFVNDWITPFINGEAGIYRYKYSFQSDTLNIRDQRLGYKVSLGGSIKPGDKQLCMALDYGVYFRILHVGDLALRVAPVYSARMDLFEDIFMGYYQNKQFRHDNFGVIAVLSYEFE